MISSLKKAIPNDVRARLIDYYMIIFLSAVFIVSCLHLVCAKLNDEFVELGNMLH